MEGCSAEVFLVVLFYSQYSDVAPRVYLLEALTLNASQE